MSVKYKTIEVNGIKVPATFHDAILKIKDGFQRGRVDFVSRGRYEFDDPDTGKKAYCPIGYLFTNAQRAALVEQDTFPEAMTVDVEDLAAMFGEDNIVTVTGMSVRDGLELQQQFDSISDHPEDRLNARGDFNSVLNNMLERTNYDNPGLKYIS
jgi:hypothetical protein